MAKKILVPVFPSEAFYDAVVAAREIVAVEGGIVTFLFTKTRPPEAVYDADAAGHPSAIDVGDSGDTGDQTQIEEWHDQQIEALDDARQLLAERGVGDDRIDYAFAEEADHESAAQAIADEAAAGAYDLVVLARSYFSEEVEDSFSSPEEVAGAIQSLAGDDVKLLVT